MPIILKDNILKEKPSGKYSCPHFISPEIAHDILTSLNVDATYEAKKMLAEVMENFGIEIVKTCNSKERLSKEQIVSVVNNVMLR